MVEVESFLDKIWKIIISAKQFHFYETKLYRSELSAGQKARFRSCLQVPA